MFRLSGYLNLYQISDAIQSHMRIPLEQVSQSWPEHEEKITLAWVDNTLFSILLTIGEIVLYHPSHPLVWMDIDALRILPDGTMAAVDYADIEPPLTLENLERFHLRMWEAHSLIHPGTCSPSLEAIQPDARDSPYVRILAPFEGFAILADERATMEAINSHNGWIQRHSGDSATPRRGRPSLQEAALSAYLKAFPDGHGDTHWSVVEDRVADIAGRKINERTIRRAISGKLGQNGQKSQH